MAKAVDPVCGMEVDTEAPPATSEYQGATYYFCSEGCKKDFDAAPWKFMGAAGLGEAMKESADMPMGSTEQATPKAKKWWEFWK
jgi:Cu+-exporting ATPase